MAVSLGKLLALRALLHIELVPVVVAVKADLKVVDVLLRFPKPDNLA